MRSGAELTYRAVAAEAGVQERTVYRHFPSKTDLEVALWDWIARNLTHVDFSPRDIEELCASIRQSFTGFDQGAPLIRAMLHSEQGLDVRRGQQAARRQMFEAVVDASVPGLNSDRRRMAAAALQVLYSATAWELLSDFYDMSGEEAAEVIEWAVRAVLTGIRVATSNERRRS